ncbi:Uncharacterised protein [Vibrio cholerae]|nr:Uncharacterised protein [Vibrio cholerae]CSD28469.1 Uncharacterised protein [Vibrio cholerae]
MACGTAPGLVKRMRSQGTAKRVMISSATSSATRSTSKKRPCSICSSTAWLTWA